MTAHLEVPFNRLNRRTFIDAIRHKAAVAAGNTSEESWTGALANLPGHQPLIDFIERTAIPFRAGFPRIPFSVPTAVQTARPIGYVIEVGGAKPLTTVPSTTVTIEPKVVGTTCVMTDESLMTMVPGTDSAITRQLRSTVVSAGNTAFIEALLSGIFALTFSGLSDEQIFADVIELLGVGDEPILIANLPMAARILAAFGNGASLLTVIVAPEAGTRVLAVDLRAVAVAWEELISVDVSKHAALQMMDDPTTGETNVVSMFQTDSSAVRVHMLANWVRLREEGVRWLDTGMES